MKTEKLSMAGIKSVLSRAEMKTIMAGSGTTCVKCCWTGTNNCSTGTNVSNPSDYTCTSGATMVTC